MAIGGRVVLIAGVLMVLLLGIAIGSRIAPASADESPLACLDALTAADSVADMLEAVEPNPAAAFDITFHQLELSGYRELAEQCRDQH